MKNKLLKWEITGIIFTIIVGTLLHFVYEWSGESPLVSLFSPVNESVWEHLKMLFFPAMIFSFIEYLAVGYNYKGFFTTKAISFIIGMLTIILLFYTYTLFTGNEILAVDIAIFIIGIIVMYVFSYRQMECKNYSDIPGIIILTIITLMFVIFTSFPPSLELFKDNSEDVLNAIQLKDLYVGK